MHWLRLCASTAGECVSSVHGQGTKIPRAAQCGQNKKNGQEVEAVATFKGSLDLQILKTEGLQQSYCEK